MTQNNNVRKAIGNFAFLLILIAGAYLCILLVLSACTGGYFWSVFTKGMLSGVRPLSLAYSILLYTGLMGVCIVFWIKTTGKPLRDIGLSLEDLPSLGKGILWGGGIFIFFFALLAALQILYPIAPEKLPQGMAAHLTINFLASLLLAFSEEFIFRGIIFKSFLQHLTKRNAVIAVSLFFAAAHMFSPGTVLYKLFYFVNLFFMSALLCTAVLKTRNIWLSSGIHFSLIYLFLIRNYLNILAIKPAFQNFLFGYAGQPMAGLYGTAVFAAAIALLSRQYGPKKK